MLLKFKCPQSNCEQGNEKASYCPDHGDRLIEQKDFADTSITDLLSKISDVVSKGVETKIKEMGLDEAGHKGMFPKAGGQNRSDTYKFVSDLITKGTTPAHEADRAALDNCLTEKEKSEFLGKARSAYFFKHAVAFRVTGDPDHLNVVKALAQGVDADGGYLVPTEFRAELIRELRDKPFLRNLVTIIPMNSNALELPTQTTNITTSWGTENASIATTTVAFGTLTFAPKRLNTLMYTSRELVADSAIEIMNLITMLFAEAVGIEEDKVIVHGSGSGQPKGILAESLGGIDNANVDANLADNIKKLPYRLSKRYRYNARWLANPKAKEAISVLKDSQNRYLMGGLDQGPDEQTLAGLPFDETGDMPVDTLLLGDFKQYYLADRQQMSIETTIEGAGTFEKHQVAIKVVERIDGKVAVTGAFKTLTNCGID